MGITLKNRPYYQTVVTMIKDIRNSMTSNTGNTNTMIALLDNILTELYDTTFEDENLLVLHNILLELYKQTSTTLTTIHNAIIPSTAAVVFTADDIPCTYLIITASADNTDRITCGGSTITDGNGLAVLYPGESIRVDISNVNLLYVIAGVNLEDASITYFV